MTAVLCAVLGGVMFYLSQGRDDVWFLAWFAPAPLLWLAYGTARRWQVFAAALTAAACGQIYIIQTYGDGMPPAAMGAMVLGWGALFGAAILFARAAWQRFSPIVALIAFPAFWTSLEYGVSLVSPHGSWGALGYSQVSFPPAIQVAALFGLYSITFLLCLFANAIALIGRDAGKAALPGLAVAGLALAFGQFHLMQPSGESVRAAALADWQDRLKTTRKLDFTATRIMVEQYADAARAAADTGARIIVIPETALAADPSWRERALQPLADTAREKQVSIIAGTVLVKPWRNAAFSFLPDGAQHGYDKRHLLLPGEGKFKPGPGPGLLGKGRAVAICKDMDFPRTLRGDALAAPDDIRLMAVPANDFVKDGWIHARMAVMRGVENGFAVVRSAFNGLETISDAQGRVLARADTNGPGMTKISADVPLGPGPTLYTRIGDAFAWASMAVSIGLGAMLLRKRPGQA